jgi:hypothetical protein
VQKLGWSSQVLWSLRERFWRLDARLVRGFCGGVRGEGVINRRGWLALGARVSEMPSDRTAAVTGVFGVDSWGRRGA